MRTLTLTLGLLLCLSQPAWAQEPTPLDLAKVPQEGKAPEDFVPSGWKIEATTRGDLDKNGKEDVVLELVEDDAKKGEGHEATDRARALLALLSAEGGKLRRAGASNRVLYCIGCQGMMGGGGGGVTKIEKGVLLVDQMSGSRETTHTVLRFRYEPKERRFVFIGEDIERTDRAVGTSTVESTNLLTGTKITEKRQYDEKQDKDTVISSKKEKVPVRKRYLEDVDISAY
ncbi:hypothetical protein [Hyalangium sp.]|uniref:hypothetical protein n=1 Tax=Hyalangium sp. TaxID=2028555 RepID=UPI002D62DEDE|nr:hypothetical protein [Hyalangium sp.]HYH95043.1 hypothetical protein [Hyalangium sp.]